MAKERIEIIASEATYENLSTFKSIEELNETVRSYKDKFAGELNKTAVAVLDVIHRHAAKYKGVAFPSKNYIAEKVGKSRRTVIRVCQRLEELGIIRQLEMKRASDMKQTSNAIVIQPLNECTGTQIESVTQDEPKMSHQEDNTFLKQIHIINHLNVNRSAKRNQYLKGLPKRLQSFRAFLGDHIKTLYFRAWLAVKKLGLNIDATVVQEVAHIAFNKLVEYIKAGRQLTPEQQCKIVYTIAYRQLEQRQQPKQAKKTVRKEMVPDWLTGKPYEETAPTADVLAEMEALRLELQACYAK
jgi:DNA-binding Lrp family transcriptional regulator